MRETIATNNLEKESERVQRLSDKKVGNAVLANIIKITFDYIKAHTSDGKYTGDPYFLDKYVELNKSYNTQHPTTAKNPDKRYIHKTG